MSRRGRAIGVHEPCGADLSDNNGISGGRFPHPADRWDRIDLLHIDTDPHTEDQTRHWFELYAPRCRAIALHDAHHPGFGVGAAVRSFAAAGGWAVHEYWGNPSGWTVLVRHPGPTDGAS